MSRALCRFRAYRSPHALSGSILAKAARAFAEAHAPFADTGTLILRAAKGAEIWYWDRSKLVAHAPVGQASPESVWRVAEDGWRVVACAEGFEAQYWEAASLLASTWRRQPFAAPQWTAFTLSVDRPAIAAPANPPEPVVLPLVRAAWRSRIIKESFGWRDAERAGASVAICATAVAALFCGQALGSAFIAGREQERAAAAERQLRDNADIARALEHQRLIRAYATAVQHPPVLAATAEAHDVLSRFGLRASTWRASAEGLSLIIDAGISDVPARDIVAAMERAPNICDAVPEVAGAGRFEIRAAIEPPGAACAARNAGERS